MIQLNIALDQINKGIPFDLKFVTYNKSTGKGGELVRVESAVKCGSSSLSKDIITIKRSNGAGHPMPVHIHLITEFNNKKIMI